MILHPMEDVVYIVGYSTLWKVNGAPAESGYFAKIDLNTQKVMAEVSLDVFTEGTVFTDILVLRTGWLIVGGYYSNVGGGWGDNHLIVEYDQNLQETNMWGLWSSIPSYVEVTNSLSLHPWVDAIFGCGYV